MSDEEIKEALGLVDAEAAQLEYVHRNRFSPAEIEGLGRFLDGMRQWALGESLPTKERAISDFSRHLPQRTTTDLDGFLQALWDDGYTGEMVAALLGRAPE